MTDTANDAIRLKSLLFWLDTIGKAEEFSMMKRFWNQKDFKGFRSTFGVCPWCGGSPAFDLKASGKDVVIHGIHIERVQCYCLTLEFLARTETRWYESYYRNSFIKDVTPIDLPPGAAARTTSIKGKLEKFLLNPTRSALINGGTGSAKSHMLMSIKTSLGGFATYITMSDFFSKLMVHTKANDGKLPRFIDNMTYSSVLLLDDFGLQHSTEYGTDVIASIINSRYERGRLAPTIMTTNLSLTEMQQVEGVAIGNLERILSRMMDADNSTVMTMLQKDYRLKQTRKEAAL